MTSIIKWEVISGAQDDSPCCCYVLQVDEFHFLIDCGWDEHFFASSARYAELLKPRIALGQIDAVLLSYADIPHLGALPYLVGKCGLSCPIYATVPVYKMGQMFMYDWFQSHQNVEDFTVFSLDDVDVAFDKVQQLKYSQNVSLKGRGHGLQITPLPAGHMLGGTIWRITKMGEEEIVYAVDFNHKKERHLNGCSFENIGRPNLLITDAYSADLAPAVGLGGGSGQQQQQPLTRRKQRDEQLLTNILQTVRNGGNVLLVIDTAGRVLELAQLLDQLWHNAEAGLITYSLVLMNNVAYNVVEFAKSQVEWMSDKILRSFEEGRYNPFQFRHVQLCHSMVELQRVRSPKVVLASQPDMESGFSRELFLEWCSDPRNSVIITGRSPANTLAGRLIAMTNGSTKSQENQRTLTLEIKRRIRLEGAELDEYWRAKKEKDQQAARVRLEAQRRTKRIETIESSGESSDEEKMDGPFSSSVSSSFPYDIMYKFELQQKSSFFKQAKKLYPMFPHTEEKIKWDEYGEIIRPENYVVVEASVPSAASGDVKRSIGGGGSDLPPLVGDDSGLPGTTENGGGSQSAASAEVPTKCIKFVQKLEVLCKLAYIDFEGRSDGESIRKILQQIKPKQLVLVHGPPDATQNLAEYCRQTPGLLQGNVFAPKVGEVVDATIESHIFQVTLTDVLMSALELQPPVKDAELAWVDGRVVISSSKTTGEDTSSASAGAQQQLDTTPVLDVLPSSAIPTHQAVFVNDPKLSDLKQLLMLNGFHAEFSAGVLYVNNVVAIRRNEAGKLNFEGCACDDYYRIRNLIYKQYAIV